jgi:hypothetical protein
MDALTAAPAPTRRQPCMEDLVGAEGWARLDPHVRARVARGRADYVGEGEFHANWWGSLCARLGLLLGRPLPVGAGACAMHIKVRPEKQSKGGGERWLRVCEFPGQAERVTSIKRFGAGPWLEETAGPLIMRLCVFEEAGALVFLCIGFRLRLFRRDLPWPLALSPGRIRVEHIDHGDGRFAFTLQARHPWFGLSFDQHCVMRDA